MRTGFVWTICQCVDIRAAFRPRQIPVRHLKSDRKETAPIRGAVRPSGRVRNVVVTNSPGGGINLLKLKSFPVFDGTVALGCFVISWKRGWKQFPGCLRVQNGRTGCVRIGLPSRSPRPSAWRTQPDCHFQGGHHRGMHTGQTDTANGERLTLRFEEERGLTRLNPRLRRERLTCSVCQAAICLKVNEASSRTAPAI